MILSLQTCLTSSTGCNSGPSAPVNLTPCSLSYDSGTGYVDDVALVTAGTWDDGGASLSYQWQRNGVDIPGATGSYYTLTQADAGYALTCVETATNGVGPTSQVSNALSPLPLSGATTTSDPVIEGTSTEPGATLSVSTPPSSAGNPHPTINYQWYFNGSVISGQTGTTLSSASTASAGDYYVQGTAENNQGSSSGRNSNVITLTTP